MLQKFATKFEIFSFTDYDPTVAHHREALDGLIIHSAALNTTGAAG